MRLLFTYKPRTKIFSYEYILSIRFPENGAHVLANGTSAIPIPITPTIKMASRNVVPILDINLNRSIKSFLQQKQISPTAKQKLSNKYSNIDIDWEKVYTSTFQCTLHTKIREFHYKILNCIIFTNCTFCQEAAKSVQHLLFSFRISC